jgi:hypothetical protein
MKTWCEQVEVMSKQAHAEVEVRSALKHTPMDIRIRKLINAMPESERNTPRPLQFYINALAPKYSGKRAAAREVATGLVELGFTKRRVWISSSQAYCAYWFPKEKQHD